MHLFSSRGLTVVAAAAVVGLVGAGSAVAGSLVTSAQIQNDTIRSIDIHDGTLKKQDMSAGVLAALNAKSEPGAQGPKGDTGAQGPKGDAATYAGPNWNLVDRNTIGNGFATLRSGPNSGTDVRPPLGIGSLGLQTGSGSDKVSFGDQVDFVGQALSTINTVKYSAFVTGEDLSAYAGNIPNVAIEVLTQGTSGYSTLNYVPTPATPNAWTTYDASTTPQWYLTGAAGNTSNCNQTTYCTLDQVKAAFPNATILTVAFNKGRDYAFQGAVDALVINNDTYDFEPFGVTKN